MSVLPGRAVCGFSSPIFAEVTCGSPFLPSLSRDAASRRALQAAIQQLAEAQPEATAKNLLHSLQSSGVGSKACVPRYRLRAVDLQGLVQSFQVGWGRAVGAYLLLLPLCSEWHWKVLVWREEPG